MWNRKRILLWSFSLLVLAASLYFGQYFFAAFWVALLVIFYLALSRLTPKVINNRISNNPFALGPIEVEFKPDSYTIRVGESLLHLGLSEFGRAHDLDDHYRLDHKSMVSLRVPKRALSEGEIQIIESYRDKYPGHPEDQTVPDY